MRTTVRISYAQLAFLTYFSVPIYDISDLTFDILTDMTGHVVLNQIPRLSREAPSNSPAIVAYYPSFYFKDGMTTVNFNIKWLAVM